jgi:hypothetical protein
MLTAGRFLCGFQLVCRAASHFSNLAALWLEQCRLPRNMLAAALPATAHSLESLALLQVRVMFCEMMVTCGSSRHLIWYEQQHWPQQHISIAFKVRSLLLHGIRLHPFFDTAWRALRYCRWV